MGIDYVRHLAGPGEQASFRKAGIKNAEEKKKKKKLKAKGTGGRLLARGGWRG